MMLCTAHRLEAASDAQHLYEWTKFCILRGSCSQRSCPSGGRGLKEEAEKLGIDIKAVVERA